MESINIILIIIIVAMTIEDMYDKYIEFKLKEKNK